MHTQKIVYSQRRDRVNLCAAYSYGAFKKVSKKTVFFTVVLQ